MVWVVAAGLAIVLVIAGVIKIADLGEKSYGLNFFGLAFWLVAVASLCIAYVFWGTLILSPEESVGSNLGDAAQQALFISLSIFVVSLWLNARKSSVGFGALFTLAQFVTASLFGLALAYFVWWLLVGRKAAKNRELHGGRSWSEW